MLSASATLDGVLNLYGLARIEEMRNEQRRIILAKTKTRLLCITSYLGGAPILWLLGFSNHDNLVLRHHCRHALALFFAFLGVFLTFGAGVGADIVIRPDMLHPDVIRALADVYSVLFSSLFFAWLVIWIVSLVLAANGATLRMLLISRIATSDRLMALSVVWTFFLQASLVLFAVLAVHSASLARHDGPADVYMVYQADAGAPRWIFTLGLYGTSLAATERWGHGSVVVAPLSRDTLNEALSYGRLVVVASHGHEEPGSIALSRALDDGYLPMDVPPGGVGPDLRFVYIAACYAGALEIKWERVLAPAEVKTYNRMTNALGDHLPWLWFEGPKVVSAIETTTHEAPTTARTEGPMPENPSLGDTWTRPADGMVMVCVPGGEFEMGSTELSDAEQPVHTVVLNGFWMDRTEVTVAQFRGFVAETGYETDAERGGWGWVWTGTEWEQVDGANWQHPQGPDSSAQDGYPVVQVSWNDAAAYCEWVEGRLPTEAEWEYAARGPEGRVLPWGGDSWCGAEYMAGNMWEWVADWYDDSYYDRSPSENPPGPEAGEYKVLRSGAFLSYEAYVRAASRSGDTADARDGSLGFRCAGALPGR